MNISETLTNILSKHSQHGLTSSRVDKANGNASKQEGRSILYIPKGSWKTNKKGENKTVNKKWDMIKSCDPAVQGERKGKERGINLENWQNIVRNKWKSRGDQKQLQVREEQEK